MEYVLVVGILATMCVDVSLIVVRLKSNIVYATTFPALTDDVFAVLSADFSSFPHCFPAALTQSDSIALLLAGSSLMSSLSPLSNIMFSPQ